MMPSTPRPKSPANPAAADRAAHKYADRRRFFNRAATVAVLLMIAAAAATAFAAGGTTRILVLGDSLTAGYGLAAADAFPVRLEAALRARGHAVTVIDAGVSGDTTAGGRARLGWALAENPQIVIVELGGNDALRGLEPRVTYANLDAIVSRLKARGIRVLLTGMVAPPNLGREYGAAFNAVFSRVAARHGIALYRFFLDGVAARPELNLADGIHPNRQGIATIVDRITPSVVGLLKPREGG